VDGTSVTLSAVVSGFTPTGYDWTRNGMALSGENGSNLIFDPITMADAGTYRVFVTDGSKATYASPPYVLTVVNASSLPVAGGLALTALIIGAAVVGARRVRRQG
jgi:hypothetical protein